MPEPRRDNHDALSSDTIFDNALYLLEALRLPAHQTDHDLDAELAQLAEEGGIQDPYRYLCPPPAMSRALSTMTMDSEPRSSISIHSQETQSTSFTAPSRTSRDQMYPSERAPPQRQLNTPARASPVAEQNDPLVDIAFFGGLSSSTLSVSRSILLESSSSSRSSPRRKRTAGFLGMFRKDSSSCTSRSHQSHQSKGRGLKVECGHSLSPKAVRVHIEEAQQRGGDAIPSCCGTPLPTHVLAIVAENEEPGGASIRNSTSTLPETVSSRDSGYCEKSASTIDLSQAKDAPTQPAASATLPLLPVRRRHEAISIDSALANEAFKDIRLQEKEQFERVAAFESSQRIALSALHETSLTRLVARYETSRHEAMAQHTKALEKLEEFQVIAEHDLRKAQDIETRNVATALKHMEAYCLGGKQSHPDHPNAVTEEDFKKLDRQRMLQQSLPRRQENAINVLRAKQERDMKNRMQKQKQELDLIGAAHDLEKAAEESEYARTLEKLEAIIETRRSRLLRRWTLRFEIWRREWEQSHDTTVDLRLEHVEFPSQDFGAQMSIPEDSALAVFVKGTA